MGEEEEEEEEQEEEQEEEGRRRRRFLSIETSVTHHTFTYHNSCYELSHQGSAAYAYALLSEHQRDVAYALAWDELLSFMFSTFL